MESMPEILKSLLEIWNLQLTVVDAQPITLGKLILGLLIFTLGYLLLKKIRRQIDKRLLGHLDIEDSLRHSFSTAIFYVLVVILALFTLRLLNVPITVFTVLGGALAIGVGFGSQNVVNNFISGLVLLLERPVRVDDYIEMEGLAGVVERIGGRATIVRAAENTYHIVPNSFFLEKSVMNWTLSDDVIRASVSVGVAYGSPVRQVEELLYQAVKNHPKVLKDPEPIVLFSNFGDNSLEFEVLYWAHVRTLIQRRKISSEIRFSIDDLFRAADIVIAFPQRDIHLDTLKPLQIEVRSQNRSIES